MDERLHILRNDVISSLQERVGLSYAHQRDGRARRGAQPDERGKSLDGLGSSATGGGRDIDRILHDRIGHVHTTCRGTQEFDVADGNGVTGERVLVYGIGAAAGQHGEHALLFLLCRIGQYGLHHETVHLRLGKIEGALFLDWILRCDDHEWFRQRDALASDGGRALRHGFKHGGLGFRVGTIDFVEQHEIGVDRADLRGEFLRGEIEDLSADQVRRHQIGSALHTFERAGHRSGQGLRGSGFCQTRDGFDEDMTAGHQSGDQRFTKIVLSDQGLRETSANLRTDVPGACDVFGRQRGWSCGCGHGDGCRCWRRILWRE